MAREEAPQPPSGFDRAVTCLQVTPLVILLLLIIGWSALAFGAVYPWASAPVGVASLTACAIALGARSRWPNRAIVMSCALVVTAVALQLVPLPGPALATVSPATEEFLAHYDVRTLASRSPVLSSLLAQDGMTYSAPGPSHPITISPERTRAALASLIPFALLLTCLSRALDRRETRHLVLGVVGLGVVLAIAALVQRGTGSRTIYGFWAPYYAATPYGPFVNRNHFAGWMLMAIPLGIADFCGRLSRSMHGLKPGFRQRILWFAGPEANRTMLVGFAVLLMAVSLVLTMSRSGILAFSLALLAAGWWMARKLTGHRRTVVVGFLCGLTLVSIGSAGVDAIARRFDTASDPGFAGRLPIWQDTLAIIRDFPLAGTGLNTFDAAMVKYETPGDRRANDAHNDYLEAASDGGVLIGIPIVIVLIVLVKEARRRLREGSDSYDGVHWTRLGALTGLLAIGLQEAFDFSLQIPANLALFVVLCLLAIGETRTATQRHSRRGGVPPRRLALETALAVCGVGVAVWFGIAAYRTSGPYGEAGPGISIDRVADQDKETAGQSLTQLSYSAGGAGPDNRWIYLDGPRVVRYEVDGDGDDSVDRWEYYGEAERLTKVALSREGDGRADTWQYFDARGTLERIDYGDLHDYHIIRVEYYDNGKLVRTVG
jgi:O-antigen ligase